jgi:hypothetical protein
MIIFSNTFITAFWLPLAVGLIIFALTYLTQKPSLQFNNLVINPNLIIVNIEKTIYIKDKDTQSTAKGNNSEVFMWVILGGLFLLIPFYTKYQIQILESFLGLTSLLFFFYSLSLLRAYNGNFFRNPTWLVFLIGIFVCFFIVIADAYFCLNPTYHLNNYSNLQFVATKDGVQGLIKVYGIKGIGFIIYQMLGFLFLAISYFYMTISLIYFYSIVTIEQSNSRFSLFLIKTFHKYCKKPIPNTVFLIVMNIVSFLLISGFIFKWIVN